MKRKIAFQVLLSENDRRRHRHVAEKGKILAFVEQYETLVEDKWKAVVRYDTAHGFAHKDILRPSGRAVKIRLAETDYNKAMTFAMKDLQENWPSYKAEFFKSAKPL